MIEYDYLTPRSGTSVIYDLPPGRPRHLLFLTQNKTIISDSKKKKNRQEFLIFLVEGYSLHEAKVWICLMVWHTVSGVGEEGDKRMEKSVGISAGRQLWWYRKQGKRKRENPACWVLYGCFSQQDSCIVVVFLPSLGRRRLFSFNKAPTGWPCYYHENTCRPWLLFLSMRNILKTATTLSFPLSQQHYFLYFIFYTYNAFVKGLAFLSSTSPSLLWIHINCLYLSCDINFFRRTSLSGRLNETYCVGCRNQMASATTKTDRDGTIHLVWFYLFYRKKWNEIKYKNWNCQLVVRAAIWEALSKGCWPYQSCVSVTAYSAAQRVRPINSD